MPLRTFDQCLEQLRRLGEPQSSAERSDLERAAEAAGAALLEIESIDEEALAGLIRGHPEWVPVLASCVGLGLEQLRRQLQHLLGTSGWITLARKSPEQLIRRFDEAFGLVGTIREQREKAWSLADVLVERVRWSQRKAAGAGKRGRALEEVVQEIVKGLMLQCEMRVRFKGKGNETAPCDVAIPGGRDRAQIVIAVKGFDSTGSKLSDAVAEISKMAEVRLARQFVYAFVDGIGWKGRKRDFRRIYDLWADHQIDGLFCLATIDDFRRTLNGAARRLNLPRARPPGRRHTPDFSNSSP